MAEGAPETSITALSPPPYTNLLYINLWNYHAVVPCLGE